MQIVDSHALTHEGKVREHNEDTVLEDRELGLWLVADGMGGHAAGEVASAITAEKVQEAVREGKKLGTAIMRAHQAVQEYPQTHPESRGMGTTVVAARLRAGELKISWVGDSRAYIFHDGKLSLISTDHSYLEMLIQQGGLKREEAHNHPQRHVVTQCVGMEMPNPDTVVAQADPGDYILLCSDGLNDELTSEQISECFAAGHSDRSCEAIAERLLANVLQTKARDNISIVVMKVGAGDGNANNTNPSNPGSGDQSWVPAALGVGGALLVFLIGLWWANN